jgi:hypothetical protein
MRGAVHRRTLLADQFYCHLCHLLHPLLPKLEEVPAPGLPPKACLQSKRKRQFKVVVMLVLHRLLGLGGFQLDVNALQSTCGQFGQQLQRSLLRPELLDWV